MSIERGSCKAKEAAVFKVQDETTESALCVGTIAAIIWGIGLSFYGLQQGPEQISWLAWGAQLIGGILACLFLPPAYVRGREWVLTRIEQPRESLQRQ
jgi:hypothetical protein